MKKFYYVTAYKGVFHQNPDYAHWYGNAPLRLGLSRLKSEAALLRQVDALRRRVDLLAQTGTVDAATAGGVAEELRRLLDRHLAGELGAEDYSRAKQEILDRHGL